MYRWHRFFFAAVIAALAIVTAAPARGASEDVAEVPVSVTALDQATLTAISQAEALAPSWTPVVAADASPPEELSLTAARALVFRLQNPSLFANDSFEVLRGPQGTLFENNHFELTNDAVASFYETNPVATVVTVALDGWPDVSEESIYELAAAFTWAGNETLEESPYPGDPLLGFANVSSFGWFDGTPFTNYARIESGSWVQYADPLLRSETTTDDGRFLVTWLLPGIPDSIALNLSYSPEATIEGMVAQHVDVAVPSEIVEYPLVADFATIGSEVQLAYGSMFAGSDEEPGASEEPIDTGNGEAEINEDPPATSGGDETDTVEEPESRPDVDETADTPATETDGRATAAAVGEEGDGGGFPISLIVIFPVVGGALAWLLYKWFFATSANNRGETDVLNPVQMYDLRNDPLQQAREWTVTLAERYKDEGGTITDEGWIAPTFGQITRPGETPARDPDEWTGYFVNTVTLERVYLDDSRYGNLLDELGMTAPVEYSPPVAESVPEQVVLGSDGGVESPPPAEASSELVEQPAIRSHAGPSQLLTAREESLGLAEALVGVVVDGWHRLPWDAGSDFYIGADGATYRTIPVANLEVSTDVNFLGEPDGFEPDESRFAYWLHEDGTLKVGSPDDPHAYTYAHPSEPGEPLEGLLPMPGKGQSVYDVAGERLVKAHELTGGKPPVDGWIAPSNEAHGAALLSDAFSRPGVDPAAWSGHFYNTETGEWVNARDTRHKELIDKLRVDPPAKPVEATKPISFDDGVLPG